MKIAIGDVASVTRYTKPHADGATGCVCLKDGRRLRVRNVDAFLATQPGQKPLIDQAFAAMDQIFVRVFGR